MYTSFRTCAARRDQSIIIMQLFSARGSPPQVLDSGTMVRSRDPRELVARTIASITMGVNMRAISVASNGNHLTCMRYHTNNDAMHHTALACNSVTNSNQGGHSRALATLPSLRMHENL